MSRLTRRATHPLAESNRTTQRKIGALADTFSSTVILHKSSPKQNYPRRLSSLVDIRGCQNKQTRSASTETQCSRTEGVAEEDAPCDDQRLHLRTDRGSLNGKAYRQDEEIIGACHDLTPLSTDNYYSMRRYLMEQDEVHLFECNERITNNEIEAQPTIPIDGVNPPYRRHTVSCERDLLDKDESSGKNQLPLSVNAWKMAISAIEDFNHDAAFDEP